ncbi:Bulb-type lectin domain containing protein [Trema orientale]|uniref:Bulb-type lectin domain containing protein n=1 Tax=Trema orientale TaxID=63057 RepID=A0A2P5D0V8_TREOI|nr:Bulb-type lectin domain containing protein [Trema orientale]
MKGDKFNLNQCLKNDLESEQMQNISYPSTVGSLMYAQIYTRPNIAYSVGMLGRYQSNLDINHWKVAKKVMRYLQETKDYMLMFRWTDNLEVIGYSDSDFIGCIDSRKSTSEYIFMFTDGAVSWRSAKQTLTTTSTMEVEFVSCFEAISQDIWIKSFISALKIVDSISRPLKIYCDNSAIVFMTKNNKSGSRSKHIDIKYLAIRERVKEKIVVIEHVTTELMIVDPLTKGMPPLKLKDHVERIGLGSFMEQGCNTSFGNLFNGHDRCDKHSVRQWISRQQNFHACGSLLVSALQTNFSLGADTIYANQSLNSFSTIVSIGGVFVLGFFSPEKPVSFYSELRISYGNLVLFKESKEVPVWSTNINSTTTYPSVQAVLLDNGHLKRRDIRIYHVAFKLCDVAVLDTISLLEEANEELSDTVRIWAMDHEGGDSAFGS